MINIVNLSGGETSSCFGIMSQQMKGIFNTVSIMEHCIDSKAITGDVEYIYMDTGAEHPETYNFLRALEKEMKIKITCLRATFNPKKGVGLRHKVVDLQSLTTDLKNGAFAEMTKKHGVPTVMTPWCTSRMKEDTHDQYCDEKYGKGNYVTWLGMRIDEPKRLKNIGKSPLIRYMAEVTDMEKHHVNEYWEEMKFRLGIKPHLGNCVFCIKKSKHKIALAARHEPEMAEQWRQMIANAADDKVVTIKKNRDGQIDFVSEANGDPEEISIPAKEAMYRDYMSFDQIIQIFSSWTDEEIENSIRSMKTDGSDGCAEECAPTFSAQLDWVG